MPNVHAFSESRADVGSRGERSEDGSHLRLKQQRPQTAITPRESPVPATLENMSFRGPRSDGS